MTSNNTVQEIQHENACELDPKVVAVDIIGVFLLSGLAVSIPYFIKRRHQRQLRIFIPWWNSMGAGIFLGTLFFHLIPETRVHFVINTSGASNGYHLDFEAVLVTGFLFILLFEQIFTDFCFEIPGLSHAHGHSHLKFNKTKMTILKNIKKHVKFCLESWSGFQISCIARSAKRRHSLR